MDPVLAFFSRNEKRAAVSEATSSNQERAWRRRNSVWAVSQNCDRRGFSPLRSKEIQNDCLRVCPVRGEQRWKTATD